MEFNFTMFKELMAYRVEDILIVSSPYDAFVMQEDGGMLEHVFSRYRGISLTRPPTFTKVSTGKEALIELKNRIFDLVVINYPKTLGMDAVTLGKKIKEIDETVPVILLAHGARCLPKRYSRSLPENSIDKVFVWTGNRNIMWTIIKWVEDKLNVDQDIKIANVRVLILIEDSPYYYSSLLPILYRAIVGQTQEAIDDSLNDEHQLWKLRARTKILLAKNYEEGVELYTKYKKHLLGIFSDTKYFRNNVIDDSAGVVFLELVKKELPHLPVLLMSTETSNKEKAFKIGANFQDKNSPSLHRDIRKFMKQNMGFGDFIFKLPNDDEVGRASNLYSLEKSLKNIPDESLEYHISRNHFSYWLMARTEVDLASKFIEVKKSDFKDIKNVREFLINSLKEKRIAMQKTTITSFEAHGYDSDSDFLRIGDGSLGGKARGLAFISKFLQENMFKLKDYQKIDISIPKTLVITTDIFDEFIDINDLPDFAKIESSDSEIIERFKDTFFPKKTKEYLKTFLENEASPLAVRSSSLLEDSKDTPFAGLYSTYMLPNNSESLEVRLSQLVQAIKYVYASVFFESPKAFSRTTNNRTEEEKMAIVVQKITGDQYGDYFYPAISGTAQSFNFYPVFHMKPEDGMAQLSLGLGKIVVEGGETIRFCPLYPQVLPQFSNVSDIMDNSQKHFYALDLKNKLLDFKADESVNLVKREVFDARDERPIKYLASSYDPNDHRIRDSYSPNTIPVLTFSTILKYETIALPKLLKDILHLCKKGFGCNVEIEFSLNLSVDKKIKHQFNILQVRPLTTAKEDISVKIKEHEIENSICHSTNALGNGEIDDVSDIVFVMPNTFNSKNSFDMVNDISKINASLLKENRKYLLIGPGRWGSSDHCLGIPVKWHDISEIVAIVETTSKGLNADPSQGTHFFQNITSLGLSYFTTLTKKDRINWKFLVDHKPLQEIGNVRHIRLEKPLKIKINGKKNQGVVLLPKLD